IMSLDAHDLYRVHTTFEPVTFTKIEPAPTLAGPPSDPSRFRRWRRKQTLVLLAADLAVLTAAASLAALSAAAEGHGSGQAWGAAVVAVAWLALLAFTGGYRIRGLQLRCLLRATVIASAAVLGATALVGLIFDWG